MARPLDQDQVVLPPPALVSALAETPFEIAVTTLVPELLFQVSDSSGSLPGACFCVEVLLASLWGCLWLQDEGKPRWDFVDAPGSIEVWVRTSRANLNAGVAVRAAPRCVISHCLWW